MQKIIVIKHPHSRRNRILAIVIMPFVPFMLFLSIFAEKISISGLLFSIFILAMSFYIWWIEYCNNNRTLEICNTKNIITEYKPTLSGRRRTKYPTNQFTSIVSYKSWHRPHPVRIEIRTSIHGPGILLSSFLEQDHSGEEFQASRNEEPPYSQQLREEIKDALQLRHSEFIVNGLPWWRYASSRRLIQHRSKADRAAARS